MHIKPEAKERYPGIKLVAYQISGIKFSMGHWAVPKLREKVLSYLKETPSFFDSPVIREYEAIAYRSCGREPKVSLLARLLLEDAFPENNDIVDVVNLMQIYEGVVASVYDWNKVKEEPYMGLGIPGYIFETGGTKFELGGRELVLADPEKVISLIPCYDSKVAYISEKTKNALVVVYGNRETTRGQLIDAMDRIARAIIQIAGGQISSMVYLD